MLKLSQQNTTSQQKSQLYNRKPERDLNLYNDYLNLKNQKVATYGNYQNDKFSYIKILTKSYGISDAAVYKILRKFKPQQ